MVVRRVLWRTACRALLPDFHPHWASRNDRRTGHPTANNARSHQRPTVPSERQFPRLHRRHRVSQSVAPTARSNDRAVGNRLRPIRMHHQFPRRQARHLASSHAYRPQVDATQPHSHCSLRANRRRRVQSVAQSMRVHVPVDERVQTLASPSRPGTIR